MYDATTLSTTDVVPHDYNFADTNKIYYFDYNTAVNNWTKGRSKFQKDGVEYHLPSRSEWLGLFTHYSSVAAINFEKLISPTVKSDEDIEYGDVKQTFNAVYWTKLANSVPYPVYDSYGIKLYTDTDYSRSCAYKWRWVNRAVIGSAYLEITVVFLGDDAKSYVENINAKKSEIESMLDNTSSVSKPVKVLMIPAAGEIIDGNRYKRNEGVEGIFLTSTLEFNNSCYIHFDGASAVVEGQATKNSSRYTIMLTR